MVYIYPLTLKEFIKRVDAPGSAVGIATRTGLDDPWIESRWESRFSALAQTGPGAQPASYTLGTWSFLEEKQPERCVDHPPPPSVEVKKEYSYTTTPPLGLRGLFWGELYLYLYLYLFHTKSRPIVPQWRGTPRP